MNPCLLIGDKIVDLLEPKPEQIDLRAIDQNLWTARRFSNNPKALVVRQHTKLVGLLCAFMGGSEIAQVWSEYHDDHEGIIGDIPGPLKSYIERSCDATTVSLVDIEGRLDDAIAAARGIDRFSDWARKEVHFYDKLAETLEWLFILGRAPEPWNRPWQNNLSEEEARMFAEMARNERPPEGLFD